MSDFSGQVVTDVVHTIISSDAVYKKGPGRYIAYNARLLNFTT